VYEFRYKLQGTTKLERISTRMNVPEKKYIGVNSVLFSVRRKIFVDFCKRWCEAKEDKVVLLKCQKKKNVPSIKVQKGEEDDKSEKEGAKKEWEEGEAQKISTKKEVREKEVCSQKYVTGEKSIFLNLDIRWRRVIAFSCVGRFTPNSLYLLVPEAL
jgi:hypothetical protein